MLKEENILKFYIAISLLINEQWFLVLVTQAQASDRHLQLIPVHVIVLGAQSQSRKTRTWLFLLYRPEVTKQCPRLGEVHKPVLFGLHGVLLNFGPTFKIQVLNLKVIHKIQDLKIRVSVNTGLAFLPTTLGLSQVRSDLLDTVHALTQ